MAAETPKIGAHLHLHNSLVKFAGRDRFHPFTINDNGRFPTSKQDSACVRMTVRRSYNGVVGFFRLSKGVEAKTVKSVLHYRHRY